MFFNEQHFSSDDLLLERYKFLELEIIIKTISNLQGCMVWTEKSVTRVTDRNHEACRVMPISDPE